MIQDKNTNTGAAHAVKRASKLTDYGKQLREKQTAKRLYGLRERQFSNYVAKAMKKKENTGELLINFLESRLDNVIYRLGYVISRPAARQFVGHGFIFINGKKVNIPSYQVSPKDIITINPNKLNTKLLDEIRERIKTADSTPSWLNLDRKKMEAKVIALPKVEESERGFDIKTIIEFYSR